MSTTPSTKKSRRNILIAFLTLIIILILLLLLKCQSKTPPKAPPTAIQPTPPPQQPTPTPAALPSSTPPPTETLTAATITAPEKVPAGSTFSLTWTGPANPTDFINLVPRPSPHGTTGTYKETKLGATLEFTAPTTPGPYELQYVTGQSRSILGRAAIEVTEVTASLDAPAEVVLNSPFTVSWTGPNNKGDYVTITEPSASIDAYNSFIEADKADKTTLIAPPTAGDFELRYLASPSGQPRKILARRPIRITAPTISLTAPDSATAGSPVKVTWTGPNNAGDYLTIVPKDTPDGQYGNYTYSTKGSPLDVVSPINPGSAPMQAQIRYMTTAGSKVLARRSITLTPAVITLSAPPTAKPDTEVPITWTGPNHAGDYITIVPATYPDSRYGNYNYTTKGSPLPVKTPKDVGDAEVRYIAGQGNIVLARIPLKIASE